MSLQERNIVVGCK